MHFKLCQLQVLIVLKKLLFTQQILQWIFKSRNCHSFQCKLITDYSKVSNTVNETVYKSEVCEYFLLTMAKVFHQMKICLTKVCHIIMVCGILYSSQNLSASLEIVSWKLHQAQFLCKFVLLCTWIIHYHSLLLIFDKTNCCPCMQTKWNYQWVQFILSEFSSLHLCVVCVHVKLQSEFKSKDTFHFNCRR